MPAADVPKKNTVEEEAGASLADAWAELDREAELKNPDEYRKAEQIFAEWAHKLAALLKGETK